MAREGLVGVARRTCGASEPLEALLSLRYSWPGVIVDRERRYATVGAARRVIGGTESSRKMLEGCVRGMHKAAAPRCTCCAWKCSPLSEFLEVRPRDRPEYAADIGSKETYTSACNVPCSSW